MLKAHPLGVCIEGREPMLVFEVEEGLQFPIHHVIIIPWRALGAAVRHALGEISIQPEEERGEWVPKLRFNVCNTAVEMELKKIIDLLLKGPVVELADVFEHDHDAVFMGTFTLPTRIGWDGNRRKDDP
ncbi:MAG: hypothetical protein DRP94_05925 [Candidatus Latescibacterota bacterium]|nr:MAG: hypothetical protein DRP94_05925 [Candidatus Latescibacterota bacterium]